MTTNEHGRISYVGGGDWNFAPTDEQRQTVDERIRERQEQRGGLLGVVVVRVYEYGCHQQVSFPDGSPFGVETDPTIISEMVARERGDFANWR